MKRIAASAALTAFCLLIAPGALMAQVPDNLKAPPRPAQAAPPAFQDNPNAPETRQRLHELFRLYPPSVFEVLRIDPSLLNSSDYLAPYPALAAFLQQHPEIARDPSYYIGEFRYNPPRAGDRSYELVQMILAGFGFTLLGSSILGVFIWLVKTAIDHRRWLRLTRTQTEVHTKLLDRLGTNEELMAYIQSPAGRRFLESAPITLEQEQPRTTNAPVSRILWSMQAGVVLGALGLGFWLVQTRTSLEVSEGFWIIGVLIAALGFGFLASAALAYVISSRLGLVTRQHKTEQEA
ncbi:MAG TPA: hypothetical protein VH436_27905 [Vicinamibacterales bacterium]|jgi:hypothetical protein